MLPQDTAEISGWTGERVSEEITKPSVLTTKVQAPRKRRMTKPPNTVLISAMPLCFAYVENSRTSKLAHAAKIIYGWSAQMATYTRVGATDGKYNEEYILDNPAPTARFNSEGTTPWMPVMAVRVLLVAPATKALVQVKSPVAIDIAAVARLQVSQPIARDVNESSNAAAQNARSDQDQPYLAGVGQLLDISHEARRARVEVSQTLSLLGILEDPVDGGEVIVADAAPRPFDIPV